MVGWLASQRRVQVGHRFDAQIQFAAQPRDGAAARLMAEFEHLPDHIQGRIIDGHRPLCDALAATVTEALPTSPTATPPSSSP